MDFKFKTGLNIRVKINLPDLELVKIDKIKAKTYIFPVT